MSTEATIKTGVYSRYFNKDFELVSPGKTLQKKSVNKAIKFVKMGKIREENFKIKEEQLKNKELEAQKIRDEKEKERLFG